MRRVGWWMGWLIGLCRCVYGRVDRMRYRSGPGGGCSSIVWGWGVLAPAVLVVCGFGEGVWMGRTGNRLHRGKKTGWLLWVEMYLGMEGLGLAGVVVDSAGRLLRREG